MNHPCTRIPHFLRAAIAFIIGLLACAVPAAVLGQSAAVPATKDASRPVISLDPSISRAAVSEAGVASGHVAPQPPANFHTFADAHLGVLGDAETLTLRFSATTRLTGITATPDFRVEQGSSCVEGNSYRADQTCTLLVRFTPRGAGHRLGRVTVAHSASVTPAAFGLGGYGYAPVLSFVPALISTVPASFPAGKGLLSSALNLSIDGGDTLYVADTGNNLIRAMDASGAFTTISSGTISAPLGVVADSFGEVYFTEPAQNLLYEIYEYGPEFQLNGATSTACTVAAPCAISSQKVFTPGEMASDGSDRIFFVDGYYGAAEFVAQSQTASYAHIDDPFTYQASTPGVLAVDSYDNLYSFWSDGAVCAIESQSFANASNDYSIYQKVAGGKNCGFAGDGGQARNAQISKNVGQMAFDAAGNLYFTDTNNERVRRIDYNTGLISTIAGNGTAGYSGDGGQANQAQLGNPSGIGVDSQGQVYVISATSSTATTQVIRKVGANGFLSFGNQLNNTAGAAHIVTLTNSGNSALVFTRAQITGDTAFTIDPNTTSCILTQGAQLNAGQVCSVGVIFKPTSTGAHNGTLQFLDNTVPLTNNVQLTGVGTLPAATVTITSPASGASFVSGSTVTFSTTVTSSSGAAPTGTVKFTVDGAAFGSPVTLASGKASVNLTGLTTASHTLGATYSGDSNYAASAQVTRTINITAKPAVKVTVTPVANPGTTCQAAAFHVNVTGSDSVTPLGTIELKVGGSVAATTSLEHGVATLSVSELSAGTHSIVASYAGDAAHRAGTSKPLTETIVFQSCSLKTESSTALKSTLSSNGEVRP